MQMHTKQHTTMQCIYLKTKLTKQHTHVLLLTPVHTETTRVVGPSTRPYTAEKVLSTALYTECARIDIPPEPRTGSRAHLTLAALDSGLLWLRSQ